MASSETVDAPPFAKTVGIELRWADTDDYGHVNNVTFVRYLEEARIRTFGFPENPEAAASLESPVFSALDDGNTFTIVAGQRLEYRRELNYSGQAILADVWITRLGGSSLDLGFQLLSADRTQLYLLATTTVVIMSLDPRRPRRVSDDERVVLEKVSGPAVAFRP